MTQPRYYFHKKCDFCNFKKNKVIFAVKDQKLVRCYNCGLVFFDRQRSDLEDIYNEDYFYQSESSNENYFDYTSRDQKELMEGNFGFAYDFIKKNTNENKKYNLLDIGAGFGYFLKYLPQNIDPCAVEVSRIACKKLKQKKINIYEGDFLKIKTDQKFDFITAFDVIEHQIIPSIFLKKINMLLKKDGVFIFTTPDYGSILNKIFGKRAPAVQPLYHNYYFEKKWLKDNLPRFGFKVINMKTTFFTKMTLSHLFLMSSFVAPLIKKIRLIDFLKRMKIDSLSIDFFRFGGIDVIVKKNNEIS